MNHLVNRFQSGFLRLRSCQDHIQRAIHAKYCLFVDLETALDLMWTDGLKHKLQQHNVTGRMFNWIQDFLTDRHIRVRVGSELSDVLRMEIESQQGNFISPELFIFIMNDIPESTNDVKLSLYADYSAIWRAGTNRGSEPMTLQS